MLRFMIGLVLSLVVLGCGGGGGSDDTGGIYFPPGGVPGS